MKKERMKPKMKKKLIDTIVIADLLSTGGIFSKLQTYDSGLGTPLFPWLTSDFALTLDKDYYLSHSGGKWISGMFERLLKLQDDNQVSDALLEIVKIIHQKFNLSWNKVYDAINTAYKPLENYDMEQKELPDITHTKTVKQKLSTNNDVYGFNSSSPVPQSKSTVDGAKLDNEEENKESGSRTLTRHGNIGVTTSQQMLQAEIDLRNRFNFMNQIMEDVDSIICLLVY